MLCTKLDRKIGVSRLLFQEDKKRRFGILKPPGFLGHASQTAGGTDN